YNKLTAKRSSSQAAGSVATGNGLDGASSSSASLQRLKQRKSSVAERAKFMPRDAGSSAAANSNLGDLTSDSSGTSGHSLGSSSHRSAVATNADKRSNNRAVGRSPQ